MAGGLDAVAELRVEPGNPVRSMLAQRLAQAPEILAKLGGECSAEYKYDGVRVQAHRTADGHIELFTRRLESISDQFPNVVEMLAAGLGPREAICEGEVVAYDAASGELRPFGEVMLRRRKHGIDQAVKDVPVGMFCFDLLYADGEDLTQLPYPERRAGWRGDHSSPRLRMTDAAEVSDADVLEARFAQALTAGCEGLMCKSVGPDSGTRPGPGAGSGSSSSGTTGPSCPTRLTSRWWARSPGAGAGPACTARCCWPPTTRTRTCSAR